MIPKRNSILVLLICIILFSYVLPISAMNMKVRLSINGQVVDQALNVQKVNDTLLIPVKVLDQQFALEVEWINIIKSVNIKLDDRIIKLRVGERQVQFGDEIKELSTKVKLVDGQALIPADFVAEILGYQMNFTDNELEFFKPILKVKDITYNETDFGEEIVITTNKKPHYKTKSLPAPERLFIDIFNSELTKEIDEIAVNNGLIFQIRSGQFKAGIVRIVLDLYQPLSYNTDVVKVGDDYQLKLKINPRIIGFRYNNERKTFAILSNKKLSDYQTKYKKEDNELIVEFSNTLLDVVKDSIEIEDNESIKKVKLNQINRGGSTAVKINFQLKKRVKFNTYNDPKNPNKLILNPNDTAELFGVKYDKQVNNVEIKVSKPVSVKSVPLKKGSRLVLDLPNTVFRKVSESLRVGNDSVEEIRIAQFNKKMSRVVVDLKKLVNYELESIQDDANNNYSIIVKLDNLNNDSQIDKSDDKSDKGKTSKDNHPSTDKSYEKYLEEVNIFKKKNRINLQINLNTKSDYKIRKFKYPNRLVIDIPGAVDNLDPDQIAKPQGIIKDVRVSQFSRDPLMSRVVFELPYPINYDLISKDQSAQIKLKLRIPNRDLSLSGRMIVIDAGHGGADPGAIGPSGIMEKKVNLDIAKRLTALLRKAGAKVKMTRTNDEYITLWSRADMANELGCDIFVSIHSNAHKGEDASGTETYIYPGSYGDTLILAKIMQSSLQEKIGLIDRGVKFERLYVLEKTTMPSILSEIAFITNEEEEQLLADPNLRQKAAAGLYEGIVAYFNR
ncbi:N-acetylmuramoyl-L-alanine amidase family protein [Selenihalanaerobacter shriftii]|uniref:N-acetylmuramoyl-L-alanine amidase n=1 Tax=Selenihalanaerobacter shriftii TaxID=142842 RepID=A0A1T4QQT5_9FIRM|nr:N-acetylmuramoyl-L-alanine amidase family protein [Selenihalanaerobacter shriftii]SKA05977.1 N-acetylmuramoyl-L-alanine amidase [Selenihalanaerobacter shriftii]